MKKLKSSSPTADRAVESPELEDEVSLTTLRTHTGLLSRMWGWMQARQLARPNTKRLRVAETVSLGEKRFVAVVQVDGRHFLIAGGPTNIALLAQLGPEVNFEDVLKKTMPISGKRTAKRKPPASRKVPAHIAPLAQKESKTIPKKQPRKKLLETEVPASHMNGTKPFGSVLKETMAIPRQPRKQNQKQEIRSETTQQPEWTIEPIGEYA